MQRLLTVQGEADWDQLRRRRLTTVLDPMVMRVADLFFAGAAGREPGRRGAAWHTIHANVGSLMTFVDAVLLWDEIPVFSSAPAPPEGSPAPTPAPAFAESRLLEQEPLAGLFWPVHVTGDEKRACQGSAIAELGRVDSTDPALVQRVMEELPAYGYEWQPGTPPAAQPGTPPAAQPGTPPTGQPGALPTGTPGPPPARMPGVAASAEPRRRFLDFVFCGLLFDAYAQRLSTEESGETAQAQRILQPKRARLLAQVATGAAPSDAFAELARRTGLTSFPTAPTFLPLLLQESDILTPAHLADRLMMWRTTGAVRDYRAWLGRLRTALATGDVPDELATDLTAIARGTGGASADLAVGVGIEALALSSGPGGLVGFARQSLSGGRHQKVMFRALASRNRYLHLSERLCNIWCNG